MVSSRVGGEAFGFVPSGRGSADSRLTLHELVQLGMCRGHHLHHGFCWVREDKRIKRSLRDTMGGEVRGYDGPEEFDSRDWHYRELEV